MKILAVLSATRNPALPDVPSVAETVPGYDASSWQGFFAHAGTPKPIVDKLNAALVADLKRPETAERFKGSASWRNRTPRTNSGLSSPTRAPSGARSSAPPVSSRSDYLNLRRLHMDAMQDAMEIGTSTNSVAMTMMRPDRIA